MGRNAARGTSSRSVPWLRHCLSGGAWAARRGRDHIPCSVERPKGQATHAWGEAKWVCYIPICIQNAGGGSRVWGGGRRRDFTTVQEPCLVTPWLPCVLLTTWFIHSSRVLPDHTMVTLCATDYMAYPQLKSSAWSYHGNLVCC